jgi:hypothetical protein
MRTLATLSGVAIFLMAACGGSGPEPTEADGTGAAAVPAAAMQRAIEALVTKHGAASKPRVERGVRQVAALWRPEDGDLVAFASEYFVPDEKATAVLLARLESELEQISGHLHEVRRELKKPTDVDIGPILPVDNLLATIDPFAHITEDLFRAKVGFVVLLNFPIESLATQLAAGKGWSREEWAAVRLAEDFARRVPAEVQQEVARAGAAADTYIAEYNLWMHHVVNDHGERQFPKGMRLISHWNLRDQIKADYAEPQGAVKQRLITKVMERIVTETIPAAVINNPRVDWDPFANRVTPAPADTVEADAPGSEVAASADPEPDTRYAQWLAQFRAARRADPYSPSAPTAIARSFELERRMPEERVKQMLIEVLTAPVARKVAALVDKDLRRKQARGLEPQDIWYAGFRPRAAFTEAALDEKTRARYPTAEAFAADIPRILTDLGLGSARAHFLAEHILVDPSRGAGHAMEAMRRGDFPHLRTRVGPTGMDYKGYNIAVHELGHNVEQVISLYKVDHTLLQGVPNNAFTEAIAFVFQARDLELLGLSTPTAESRRLASLDAFWMSFEIAGVGLVDLETWHWLYQHPNATPAQLRATVVGISREVWNEYYAPIFGVRDVPLLGIYSHLVAYPLYVMDYTLGHFIAFQIEEHLARSKDFGAELERMASIGSIAPDLWMQQATGATVSTQPLIKAAEQAAR